MLISFIKIHYSYKPLVYLTAGALKNIAKAQAMDSGNEKKERIPYQNENKYEKIPNSEGKDACSLCERQGKINEKSRQTHYHCPHYACLKYVKTEKNNETFKNIEAHMNTHLKLIEEFLNHKIHLLFGYTKTIKCENVNDESNIINDNYQKTIYDCKMEQLAHENTKNNNDQPEPAAPEFCFLYIFCLNFFVII